MFEIFATSCGIQPDWTHNQRSDIPVALVCLSNSVSVLNVGHFCDSPFLLQICLNVYALSRYFYNKMLANSAEP